MVKQVKMVLNNSTSFLNKTRELRNHSCLEVWKTPSMCNSNKYLTLITDKQVKHHPAFNINIKKPVFKRPSEKHVCLPLSIREALSKHTSALLGLPLAARERFTHTAERWGAHKEEKGMWGGVQQPASDSGDVSPRLHMQVWCDSSSDGRAFEEVRVRWTSLFLSPF